MDLTKNIAYYRPPNALFTKKIIYKLVYHILPDRIIQEVSWEELTQTENLTKNIL